MAILADARTKRTGFPFNFSRNDYAAELQYIPTADLLADVESTQWLALDVAENGDDDSRDVAECQLAAMVDELERRQRLLKARQRDPLRPTWPTSNDAIQDRVRAVKRAWPIERFCRDLLACELTPAGAGKWKAHCPFPGHDDRTPSFVVNEGKDFAWCHGCQRGGDVIKLSQYIGGLERFMDALQRLERAA